MEKVNVFATIINYGGILVQYILRASSHECGQWHKHSQFPMTKYMYVCKIGGHFIFHSSLD